MSDQDDLDRRLRAYAGRWQAEQPPAPSMNTQALADTHRPARAWLLVSAAVAAVALTIVAVQMLARPDTQPSNPRPAEIPSSSPSNSPVEGACPVGEQRTVLPGIRTESVLLGCARLDDGRKVELLNMLQGSGCLQIVGIDNRARQCGYAPSQVEPPMTEAIRAWAIAQRNGSAPLEVYGATSAEVITVSLRYTLDASAHRTRAELIRVTDRAALEEAGIAEPFGYFLAELPPQTSKVRAVALDANGQMLGADDFEPILQSQPRRAMITGPIQ